MYTGCEATVVILLKTDPWDSLSNISRARNQLVIVTTEQCEKRDKLERLVGAGKVKKMSIDTISQEEGKRTGEKNSSLGKGKEKRNEKRRRNGKASSSSPILQGAEEKLIPMYRSC